VLAQKASLTSWKLSRRAQEPTEGAREQNACLKAAGSGLCVECTPIEPIDSYTENPSIAGTIEQASLVGETLPMGGNAKSTGHIGFVGGSAADVGVGGGSAAGQRPPGLSSHQRGRASKNTMAPTLGRLQMCDNFLLAVLISKSLFAPLLDILEPARGPSWSLVRHVIDGRKRLLNRTSYMDSSMLMTRSILVGTQYLYEDISASGSAKKDGSRIRAQPP